MCMCVRMYCACMDVCMRECMHVCVQVFVTETKRRKQRGKNIRIKREKHKRFPEKMERIKLGEGWSWGRGAKE